MKAKCERRTRCSREVEAIFPSHFSDAGHGTLYKFVVGGQELPDPYARYLPAGVHGPAMVVDSKYTWKHPAAPPPPPGQEIIYEVHVGTFTNEGTFEAARGRLDYLAELGVTAVELMPLSSFAGGRGWGYDGVAHFAPFAGYGTPDDLRRFIDAAHERGLRVLLDVVYNHFGPAGNYLRQFSKSYFTSAVHNAWGEALDFRDEAMRRYVLDNARYWFTEFRIDGLRLDAIQTIVDPSPRHILAELGDQASKFAPPRILIGEDDANDPRRISEMGLTGVWADDFHHALHVTLTGETDGYYSGYPRGAETLARIIERGWLYEGEISPSTGKPRGHRATGMDAAAFVYCLQNHDQIGNRAVGDRLTERVSPDAYRAASVLLLLLPMTPLLFMGQEWGATSPFLYFTDHEPDLGKLISLGRRDEFKSFRDFADPERRASIPDPQSLDTFARSRLRWEERDARGTCARARSLPSRHQDAQDRPRLPNRRPRNDSRVCQGRGAHRREGGRLRGPLDFREPRQRSGARRHTPCRRLQERPAVEQLRASKRARPPPVERYGLRPRDGLVGAS